MNVGTEPLVWRDGRTVEPEALLRLRSERGLSRERLAALAGLAPRTITGIERQGVCAHRSTALALAVALGCEIEELSGATDA